MRNFVQYLVLFVKGIAMGTADVIPGVSGGTIAFISGIYEELLDSLKSIDVKSIKKLFNAGVPAFWAHVNGDFLLAVLLGVVIAFFSLAHVVTFLLSTYPVLVWSFFFGLIIGSVYYVGKKIKKWTPWIAVAGIVGTIIAYYVTIAVPAETSETMYFVFLAGFIAICAMILPGISGSFILLLLGKYQFVLSAIKEFDLSVILVFGLGCITGLLSFARLISWFFKRFHDITVALLAGFMLGSLNKVWPWKIVLNTRINSDGKEVPFLEKSVFPGVYEQATGYDAMLWAAIGVAVVGIVIILLFETVFVAKEHESPQQL